MEAFQLHFFCSLGSPKEESGAIGSCFLVVANQFLLTVLPPLTLDRIVVAYHCNLVAISFFTRSSHLLPCRN